MHLFNGRNDEGFNLYGRLASGHGMLRFQKRLQRCLLCLLLRCRQVCRADERGHAREAFGPAIGRHADPLLTLHLGDEDDLPLARVEQVTNDEVVRVLLQGILGLLDQDGGVCLQLEAHYDAVRGPAVDQLLQELGYGLEVDDQLAALCASGRGVLGEVGGGVLMGKVLVGLYLVLDHAMAGHEEVGDGGGEVEHGTRA